MARQLSTNRSIDNFITRVIGEANHHGGNVNAIIKPLSDKVRQRLNLTRDKVEVYERNGKMARTCWVTINARRYCFSYNYKTEKIELRDRSTHGTVRKTFDNNTPIADIITEVAKL